MRTVRRLYFYLVAFISLEVIIWGIILLARTLFDTLPGGGASNMLASGLSLVLVGVPIFLIHWSVAQRDAARDEEERSTRLRAVFLYAVLLSTLIPAAQNVLAIINRSLTGLLVDNPSLSFVGGSQSLPDNLVAIAMNLVAWAYFDRVLRSDWQSAAEDEHLLETRRLYRYAWMLYGLGLAVAGVHQILRFLFSGFYLSGGLLTTWLSRGIALALVGAPIWAFSWRTLQKMLAGVQERRSALHLAVPYILSLFSAVTSLSAVGALFASMLRWILGEQQTLARFLLENSNILSVALIAAVLWLYYGEQRQRVVNAIPDEDRRAGLDRLYAYILAFLGNAATFAGAWILLSFLADLLLSRVAGVGAMRGRVAAAVGLLLVGVPVWLRNWLPLQAQAQARAVPDAPARRSLVRRVYLYLALFLTVVGVMGAAGALLYLVISTLLGSTSTDFVPAVAQRLLLLVLVAIWLAYHQLVLRGDGQRAQKLQTQRYNRFPVLVIQADDHPFAAQLTEALQRQAPGIPVAVHRLDLTPLDTDALEAKAVVMPAGLAARPPEALRLWLNEYSGTRILVPLEAGGWVFVGDGARSERDLVQQTIQAVRSLAEGQPVRMRAALSPWAVAGYVLGALFALQIVLLLVTLGINLAYN